jgi:uncharacterized protein (DUF2147 family)
MNPNTATGILPRQNHQVHPNLFGRASVLASVVVISIMLSAVPLLGQTAASVASSGPLFGRWMTDNGNLEVELAPCGPTICGTVVKVLANRSMTGSGEMKAADNRSPLGLKILSDFSPAGEGEWQGEIYNRENGKTYSCKLSLEGTDQLAVRAYVLLPLFGKTLIWRRADAAVGQK